MTAGSIFTGTRLRKIGGGAPKMNDSHSRAIVFLLAAILCVMLFGASAVLTGLGWKQVSEAFWAVAFLVVAGVARLFASVRDEMRSARAEGKPWPWLIVGLPAIFANFGVFAVAAFNWLPGDVRFRDALDNVPYWWVPVSLIFASMVVAAIERANEWLPRVPKVAAALTRTLLILLDAPILLPRDQWRSIHQQRARGELVGPVSAGLIVLGIRSEPVGLAVRFVAVLVA